ncbi:MAG: rhodanese-like domain-containing protein, partial [Verrucomicrobiales bacterium]
ARTLYASLRNTASLPEHLQILPAHGAGSACGKALGAVPVSVLGYERRFNGPFREALEGSEDGFVRDILSGQPEPPLYFARMKRDNKKGPALLPDGKLPRPRRLAANELPALVGDYAILDLRNDRVAFMDRHLKGSLFAPLIGGKLPIVAGSYVDENASILLVVNDESEVDEAVRQLVRIGLDKVIAWIPSVEALSENSGLIAGITRINTSELAGALKAHPDAAVLDVRGTSEYAASHVLGAVHIPYTRLTARLEEVPEFQQLYVHCGSGLRASFAAPYLASEGGEVVYVNGAFGEISPDLIS